MTFKYTLDPNPHFSSLQPSSLLGHMPEKMAGVFLGDAYLINQSNLSIYQSIYQSIQSDHAYPTTVCNAISVGTIEWYTVAGYRMGQLKQFQTGEETISIPTY